MTCGSDNKNLVIIIAAVYRNGRFLGRAETYSSTMNCIITAVNADKICTGAAVHCNCRRMNTVNVSNNINSIIAVAAFERHSRPENSARID